MSWRSLKALGLGLAADLGGDSGLRQFCGRRRSVDYLNLSAHATQLSKLRYYIQRLPSVPPIVFHTLNFNTATADREPPEILAKTNAIVKFLRANWMASDIAVWVLRSGVYQDALMLPPILDRRSVNDVCAKVRLLQGYFRRPFLLENPPFAAVPGKMHILEFMAAVAQRSGCGLVLDIGHLLTYQALSGETLETVNSDDIPLNSIAEVHVAGLQEIATPSGYKFLDRHDVPIREDCWSFLERHLPRMVHLKGITLEQERCAPELIWQHVNVARKIIRRRKPLPWR